ncbi:MAG TPA: sulfatase-like hydrolase/transferase, partial [Candidatus Anammoximicrobium sp.]|nr:sulfatase-like hydrolase/transferase [Candidatus Anammoximicrobium sp.]
GRLTLPAMLRAQGYATACIGKWHVGLTFFDSDGQPIHGQGVEAVQRVDYSRRIEGGPLDHGFDRFFGTACCPTTDWLYAFIEGDRVPVPPAGKIDKRSLPQHPYANDCREGVIAPNFPLEEMDLVFLKKSREFLESHVRSAAPRQPFFLYHAAQAVHLPSFPADEFQGKTQAGPHGDFIHELDYVVGELLATLDQLGVAENTVVIFTSDNGPETTAVLHMRADYGHDGARPWRGMKRDQWEGGHRVPFLVRWPGLVKPGTTSAQLTSLTDVMATVAAIIGADLPEDAAEDSFSMLPALLGEDSGPLRPYLLQQAFGGPRYLAIRRGNWKYLDHTGSGGNRYDDASPLKPFFLPDTAGGAPGQLYDLETDPGETKNLYFEQPQIVKELKALLEQSKASGRSRPERSGHHPQRTPSTRPEDEKQRQVTLHSRGLHGYIGFSAARPPAQSEYSAGMGFYSAVWPLIDQPWADFQIGLAGSWIMPDNSDNKDRPLAPEGTLARTWKERGPTWSSVFQTVEGGLGYWAGNHFRYGPPKFSMNATPQCYDYEVGSPGWSFFYSNEALPDHRLGIAQLSNRLLIPPDALPFQGNPNGQFLGYAWMALPFTDPVPGNPPTGDQSWTCFLNAANFKGPIAYYIPETWSKIGKLFHDPFLYGRGLDARPATMGGGAMEINTVPRFDALDAQGVLYSRIPKLQFPVDEQGRSVLVQDVTYYSKAALYDAFKVWRDGGPACSGRFDQRGVWKSPLTTKTTRYQQGGQKITGVERVFDTKVFEDHVWGLQWFENGISPQGVFPQYFQRAGEERVVVAAADVPAETGLHEQPFKLAGPGARPTSPETAA